MAADQRISLATRPSLVADLRRLGLRRGMTVIVHTSLSALGQVVGGEQTVLAALRDAVGSSGTLVMPTQSWQLCDPAFLNDPTVPRELWPLIRDHLPIYDRWETPTRTMGAVAELFRKIPGSQRSSHPHRSFTASGPGARDVIARHDLDSPVGEGSPLSWLYEVGAYVLLLGVGHSKNTALHLAEHRCSYPGKHHVRNGAALLDENGRRRWKYWDELSVSARDFEEVADAFDKDTRLQRSDRVARAPARLLPMVDLIDFAVGWFPGHRAADLFGSDTTGW